MSNGWGRLRKRHGKAAWLARQEAARQVKFGGRQDPANLLVILGVALLVMVIAVGGVLGARAAGFFEPQVVRQVEDPRRLTNLRADLTRNPIVDTVWHGPDESLYVLKRGNLVQRYHQPTGLWHDEPLGGAEQGVAGQVIYLQSGCGDDPRLEAGDSDCEDVATLWALTDSGGLLRRRGGKWQVLAGGSAFVGADGRAVSAEEITAVARSTDGETLLFGAGLRGLGLYHITGRRWLPLPEEQHRAIAQAAVREVKAVGDGFAIATGDGLYAFARPGTDRAQIQAHETVIGAVRLLVSDSDGGLMVLEDLPCETGAGLLTCQRLSRLRSPLGEPEVLIHEKSRASGLQMSDLTGVFWLDDHLVLTGPAGVHAYDGETHSFTEIENGRVLTARLREGDGLYYGVAGTVGLLREVGETPELWGLEGGAQVTQIQFAPDAETADSQGDVLALTADGSVFELAAESRVDSQLRPNGIIGSAKGLRAIARRGDWVLFVGPGPDGGRVYRHNVSTRKWLEVPRDNREDWLTNPDARFVQHGTVQGRGTAVDVAGKSTALLYGLVGGGSATQGGAISIEACLLEAWCKNDHPLVPVRGDLVGMWAWRSGLAALTTSGGLYTWAPTGGARRGSAATSNATELIGPPPPELLGATIRNASLSDDRLLLATDRGSFSYTLGTNQWQALSGRSGKQSHRAAVDLPGGAQTVALDDQGELADLAGSARFGGSTLPDALPAATSVRQVVGNEDRHHISTGREIYSYNVATRRWDRKVTAPRGASVDLIGGSGERPVYIASRRLYEAGQERLPPSKEGPVLSAKPESPRLDVGTLLAVERGSRTGPYLTLFEWGNSLDLQQDQPLACIAKRPTAGLGVNQLIDVAPLDATRTAILHNRGLSLYDAATANWTTLIEQRQVSPNARLEVSDDKLVWIDAGSLYRMPKTVLTGGNRSASVTQAQSCQARVSGFSRPRGDQQVASIVDPQSGQLYWVAPDGVVKVDVGGDAETSLIGATGKALGDFAPGRLRRAHKLNDLLWVETASGLSGYDLVNRRWTSLPGRWPQLAAGQGGVSILAGNEETPTILATGRGVPRIGRVEPSIDRLVLGPLDLPGPTAGWRKAVGAVTDSISWQDRWVFAFETGLKLYDPAGGRWVEYGPLPADSRRNLMVMGNALVVLGSTDQAFVATDVSSLRGGTSLTPAFVTRSSTQLRSRALNIVAPRDGRFGEHNGKRVPPTPNGLYELSGGRVTLCPANRRSTEDRGCTQIWPAPVEGFVQRPRRHWETRDITLLWDGQNASAIDPVSRSAVPGTPAIVAGGQGLARVVRLDDGALAVLTADQRAWRVDKLKGWQQLQNPQAAQVILRFTDMSVDDLGVVSLLASNGSIFRVQSDGVSLREVGPGTLPPGDLRRELAETRTETSGGVPSNLFSPTASALSVEAGQLVIQLSGGQNLRLSAYPAVMNSLTDGSFRVGELVSTADGRGLRHSSGAGSAVALNALLNGGRLFAADDARLTLEGGDTVVIAQNDVLWSLPLDRSTWQVDWPKAVIPAATGQIIGGAPGGFELPGGALLTLDGRVSQGGAWPRLPIGLSGSLQLATQPGDLLINGVSAVQPQGWSMDQRLGFSPSSSGTMRLITGAGYENVDSLGDLARSDALRFDPIPNLGAVLQQQPQRVIPRPQGAQIFWQRTPQGLVPATPAGRVLTLSQTSQGLGFDQDRLLSYAVLPLPGPGKRLVMATAAGLVEQRYGFVNQPEGDRRLIVPGNFAGNALLAMGERLFLRAPDGAVSVLEGTSLRSLPRGQANPFTDRALTPDAPLQWRLVGGRIRVEEKLRDADGRDVTRPARLEQRGFVSDQFTAMALIDEHLWLGTRLGVEIHDLNAGGRGLGQNGQPAPVQLSALRRDTAVPNSTRLLGHVTEIGVIDGSNLVRAIGPDGCWMIPKPSRSVTLDRPRRCTGAELTSATRITSIGQHVGFWQWQRDLSGKVEFEYLNRAGRVTAGPYTPDGKALPHDRITSMADCGFGPLLTLSANGILTIEQRQRQLGGQQGSRSTEFISRPDGMVLDCQPRQRQGSDPTQRHPHLIRGQQALDFDLRSGQPQRLEADQAAALLERRRMAQQWSRLRLVNVAKTEAPRFEVRRSVADGGGIEGWVPVPFRQGRLQIDRNLGVLSTGIGTLWTLTPVGFVRYEYRGNSTDQTGRELVLNWDDRRTEVRALPDGCATKPPVDVIAVESKLEFSCGDTRWQALLDTDASPPELLPYVQLDAPELPGGKVEVAVDAQDAGWAVTRSQGAADISYSISRWGKQRRLSQGRFGFDQLRSLSPRQGGGWSIATGAAGWMQVEGQDFDLGNWSPPADSAIDPASVLRLTAGAEPGSVCFDVEGGRSIELAANGQQAQRAQCLEVLGQDGLWVYRRDDAGRVLIEAEPRGGGIARRDLQDGRFSDDIAIGFAAAIDGDDGAKLVMPVTAGLLRLGADGEPLGLSIPDFEGLRRGEVPTAIMAAPDGDSVLWPAGNGLAGEGGSGGDLALSQALPQGGQLISLGQGPRGQVHLRWRYQQLISTSTAAGDGATGLSNITLDLTRWPDFIANRERWGDPPAAMDIVIGQSALGVRLPGQQGQYLVAGTTESEVLTTALSGERLYLVEPDNLRVIDLSQLMESRLEDAYGR